MLKGAVMDHHLGRCYPCVLVVALLALLTSAAPGLTTDQREAEDAPPPTVKLANPFGSTEEEHRLLQSYVQTRVKHDQGEPEITTWEQALFFLFGLYDYDRSGFLDGLEMMKLLSDYNSQSAPGVHANQVVPMVDFLLQTQDMNQDGLLGPSELLSPQLAHTQDSSTNDAPQQEQQGTTEEKQTNSIAEEDTAGAVEQKAEAHEEAVPPQEEGTTPEEGANTEEEEVHVQEEQRGEVPVHQGQPEI